MLSLSDKRILVTLGNMQRGSASRGRWELAESWTPEKFSDLVLGGSGGYNEGGAVITDYNYPPLKSGRFIKVAYGKELSDSYTMTIVGREKGY